jgi:hypothetical protein
MPVTKPDYSSGQSTTTTLDAGTYSLKQITEGLSIPQYDYISLTYVAAGNGTGEIQTVTYKQGGASGQTVATLTLGYDGSNRLSSVTRS